MLAWYIAPPTLVALINPHKGKFNVTAKGGLVEEEYVDWVISRPYIFLVLLNLVGVAVGIWRYFYGPPTEMLTSSRVPFRISPTVVWGSRSTVRRRFWKGRK